MSTSFTTHPLEILQALPLAQLLVHAQQWVNMGIVDLMAERGHADLTTAHLAFLANLDCGETHASEVARRMGVSRQAVYRTTRELQALDVLALEDDPDRRNQKIIRMTPYGVQVVTDARACNAAMEETLKARLGARDYDRLVAILRRPWGLPAEE